MANVTVKLRGPVWDEDGTLYREGTREVPRALAERLGMVKGAAKAQVADTDATDTDSGEDAKPAAKKTAKGRGK